MNAGLLATSAIRGTANRIALGFFIHGLESSLLRDHLLSVLHITWANGHGSRLNHVNHAAKLGMR